MILEKVETEVPAVPPDDGRAARRRRNLDAVLDAAVELFSEGNLDPDPDEVALRAGVSARSVYRYFEDRDALVRAAIDRQLERVFPLYLIHEIGHGDLSDRIEALVIGRLRLYEAIAPTARAARLRANVNEIIREQVEVTRRALREQVERQFSPELDLLDTSRRRALSAAVDALCQFESLDHYRMHRRFSSTETRLLLMEALGALLTPALMAQEQTQPEATARSGR